MKKRICSFTGHSDFSGSDEDEMKIIDIVENLILNYNVKEFWVGNFGSFDKYSAGIIRRIKKKYSNVSLELVVPYITKELIDDKKLYEDLYDNVLIADIPEKTPKRYYINKCNEYIVDNSDFLICYINRSWGGAVKTYTYAKRKGKKIFNIANEDI